MKRFLSGLALVPFLYGPALAFEGTVTSRVITVSRGRLPTVIGGASAGDPTKAFDLAPEKILAKRDVDPNGIDVKTTTVSIRGSKVRIDGTGGPDNYAVLDTAGGTIDIIFPAKKRYVRYTRNDLGRIADDAAAAVQKTLKEQMANAPEEARQQMEARLQQLQAKDQNAAPAKALGKSEKIRGMQATAYEVRQGDDKTIGWVTKAEADLAKAFKAFQDLRLPTPSGGNENPMRLFVPYGLPLRVQRLDQLGYQVSEVTEIKPKSLAADLFDIPTGLAKLAPGDRHPPTPKEAAKPNPTAAMPKK